MLTPPPTGPLLQKGIHANEHTSPLHVHIQCPMIYSTDHTQDTPTTEDDYYVSDTPENTDISLLRIDEEDEHSDNDSDTDNDTRLISFEEPATNGSLV